MLVAADAIEEITRSVFTNALGVGIVRGGVEIVDEPRMFFTVDVTGAWSGSIRLDVGTKCARHLANAMFKQGLVGNEDVADAMGELANVIGGNVKGLLPGPSHLSVPRAGGGGRFASTESHSFTCDGYTFRVSVSSRPFSENEP